MRAHTMFLAAYRKGLAPHLGAIAARVEAARDDMTRVLTLASSSSSSSMNNNANLSAAEQSLIASLSSAWHCALQQLPTIHAARSARWHGK